MLGMIFFYLNSKNTKPLSSVVDYSTAKILLKFVSREQEEEAVNQRVESMRFTAFYPLWNRLTPGANSLRVAND